MLEMAFYWSLLFTQFTDVKRKDFWEMFIHHIATLALLTLSWSNQMHRMGSLVLMVHDLADHWMELAKLCKYAGYEVTTQQIISNWILWAEMLWHCVCDLLPNLDLLPHWNFPHLDHLLNHLRSSSGFWFPPALAIHSVFSLQLVQMFPVYYIFNFLMTLLLILHVFWYYLITLIAYRVCSPLTLL